MNSERSNSNVFNGILLGSLVGFAFAFGGYLLLRGDQREFGWVMFLLVPFVSGFAVAAVVRRPDRILACCITGGVLTLSILVVTGLEGIVCAFMAAPLIAAGMALGAFIGYHVRGKFIDRSGGPGSTTTVILLLCPFLIAAADRVERPFRSVQQRETFTSEVMVSGTPEQAWSFLERMDHLDGAKPFLLSVGLPLPQKCELDKAAVGGKRVCYFHNGLINQEVTEWQRPNHMGLRITGSTLPGRHWLSFIEASYELSSVGNQTRVVRHTTIGTRLYPRWYWRPLERWGVTSEHEYVLSNLERWTKEARSEIQAPNPETGNAKF
ncbi:SRPBCC family protein [Pedosphaera parvula]|uniref:Polyketide cyclase/dehydrase n=1 Tax=Pedosphaera parvula (strain Ellin514) TaxID=320771 RepID=B9XQB5_PEDPL|nr:SRPBCC family protein [Pedosphaera parvula]EEF57939.1 hypothetical protein Cflav_PD1114 [Pedosphaera parvula Ellin514]